MNQIQLAGEVITSANYTTQKLFYCGPKTVCKAAQNFLTCGITEIEIPQAVLNPDNHSDTGCDKQLLTQTINGLPKETKVIATYLSGNKLGVDNDAYVQMHKKTLNDLFEYFPDMKYAMLHPGSKTLTDPQDINGMVDAYAQLAEYATSLRKDFQLCFHNHYDSNGETAPQMRTFLSAIEKVNLPSLRWGLDTGQSHGMGDEYITILDEYAHLIGDYVHLKGRVPAFDKGHGGDEYQADRDIWSNTGVGGGGLYGGFVNMADPENVTPLDKIFKIIREKSCPASGIVHGALEIDNPRQHPRLEILCATLFLKNVHGIESAQALSNDQMIANVFKTNK
ncbi:MAG: TIM barrel protein [Phycisphaeraceae bacterium]|nr:TIM barrel protein [Phycisphaeraceae bacterium]